MVKAPLKDSELKLNVYVAPMGDIHLADCDFECLFYTYSRHNGILLKKEDMTQVDNDNFLAKIDTAILGAGLVKVIITAHVPDSDFEKGYRIEKAEFITEETIIP